MSRSTAFRGLLPALVTCCCRVLPLETTADGKLTPSPFLLQHGLAGLLPTLVTSLDLVFQATQFPAALAALAAAADLVADSRGALPALHGAFMSSASLMARVFQVQF